jgi:hypothetical protein
VLVNFSAEPRRPRLALNLPGHTLAGSRLANPQTGAVTAVEAEGEAARVELAPFEVVVGRLD